MKYLHVCICKMAVKNRRVGNRIIKFIIIELEYW